MSNTPTPPPPPFTLTVMDWSNTHPFLSFHVADPVGWLFNAPGPSDRQTGVVYVSQESVQWQVYTRMHFNLMATSLVVIKADIYNATLNTDQRESCSVFLEDVLLSLVKYRIMIITSL